MIIDGLYYGDPRSLREHPLAGGGMSPPSITIYDYDKRISVSYYYTTDSGKR